MPTAVDVNHDHASVNAWVLWVHDLTFPTLPMTKEQFDLPGICLALAHLHRFGGRGRMTIAEHSLHVGDIYRRMFINGEGRDPGEEFHALVHDLHEAFIGDIPRPVKAKLDFMILNGMDEFDHWVELQFDRPIREILTGQSFPASDEIRDRVKQCDRLAVVEEMSATIYPYGLIPMRGLTFEHRKDVANQLFTRIMQTADLLRTPGCA